MVAISCPLSSLLPSFIFSLFSTLFSFPFLFPLILSPLPIHAAGQMCVGPNWLAGLTERHAELESASKMSLDEYQLRVERAAAS